MTSINYMNNDKVKAYYEKWELNPTLLGIQREYFYKFVKACLEVDKRASTEYLQLALYDSFHDKYDDEREYDELKVKVVVLFEDLRDFHNTTMP
ncbi:MAG: hypothetical protein WBB97_01275 [Dehalococcoidales bacterium]